MSFKKYLRSALATVTILAVAASAYATTLSVAGDVSSTYMAEASTINGSFDINPVAGGLGYSAPYNVIGGTMTFNFSDNSDPNTSSVGYSTQFTDIGCFNGSCFQTGQYYFLDITSTSWSDPIEQVDVTSSGMSGSATSNSFYSTSDSGIFSKTHQECLWGACVTVQDKRLRNNVYYPVYTKNVTYYYGYTGDFSLTMSLDSTAILDLLGDGVIDFEITAGAGDFIFQSALLNVTVNENGVIPGEPNPIPEPGTLALLGLGIAGAALAKRRIAA